MLTSSPRRGTRPAWAAGHPCTPLSPCGCIPPAPSSSSPPQHQCSAFEFSPHTCSHGAGQPQQRALSLLSTRPQSRGAKAFEHPCAPGQRQHHGPQNFFIFLIFFPHFLFCEAKSICPLPRRLEADLSWALPLAPSPRCQPFSCLLASCMP